MRKYICIFFSIVCLLSCESEERVSNSTKTPFTQIQVFPFSPQHTHGSSIVELPNGDLLSAWFQGSGERWADDVAIMGARMLKGQTNWSSPFVMADVPGFPDINPALFLDSKGRLYLSWYTVIANLWESSLPKYRISDNYMMAEGPPEWDWQEVLHVKPGKGSTERGIQPNDPFVESVLTKLDEYEAYLKDSLNPSPEIWGGWKDWRADKLAKVQGERDRYMGYLYDDKGGRTRQELGFPLFRRIGWQTKNKAVLVDGKRLILPLYSDGLGCTIMAITDDDGENWSYSEPLIGFENIQASIVSKKDGSLLAYMRDNGPPPQRLQVSTSLDKGMTWSLVKDSQLPNPGSGADLVVLANGHWVIAYNDTEDGRHSLAISISEDEGKTWKYTRHLELHEAKQENGIRASYPSIIQGMDGVIHVVYSFSGPDEQGNKQETIKYAKFREAWVRGGGAF